MKKLNQFGKIIMLLFGISMTFIGVIHLIAPNWYHESFYPKFEYHNNHIFDFQAVKTIGLWALMTGVMAIYAFINWTKSKMLIRFMALICFAFVAVQVNAFLKGYFPLGMAFLFVLSGVIFFLITELNKAKN